MQVKRLSIVLLVGVMLLWVTPMHAQASSNGTCRYLNGYPMYYAAEQQLTKLFELPCGSYWLDNNGDLWLYGYGYIGNIYPPESSTPELPVISGIPGPNRDGSYGPFATIRRALEVVRMFKNMGYPNTIQYHNGDGQYVFPRR